MKSSKSLKKEVVYIFHFVGYDYPNYAKKEGIEMHFNKLKRSGAVLLALALAVSLIGCKKGTDTAENVQEATEEQQESTTEKNPDYAQENVNLPDNFDNMIYPVQSLMMESYSKGLPYFSEDLEEDQGDSFWFSMAVLTSLMDTYVKDVTVNTDEKYLYLSDDTVDMYATALYQAYGEGVLEFPELTEDNTYAVYDDENEVYGFLKGSVGDMTAVITDCREDGAGYLLTAELRNTKSLETYGSYEIGIVDTPYEGEENAFAYSVDSFRVVKEYEENDETEDTEEIPEATEEMEDTETTEETAAEEETSDRGNFSVKIGDDISQDDALEIAKEYYGDDAKYSYKGKVTIGDYEYYDFSITGEDISATDVLVSVDGNDIIGGTENDDGSWSFEQ